MKPIIPIFMCGALALLGGAADAKTKLSPDQKIEQFIDKMVSQHKFNADEVRERLNQAKVRVLSILLSY